MAPIGFSRFLVLTLAFAVPVAWIVPASAGEVLVAHPSLEVQSLDAKVVRSLFLGKTTKLGEAQVTIVAQTQGETHEAFLREYVGKSPQQFLNFWRKQAFTGKASLPPALDSDAAVVDWVARNEGAIGYVSDTAEVRGVTVIRIQ